MKDFVLFTEDKRKELLKPRKGEKKFGEKIYLPTESSTIDDFLENTPCPFVLYGIEESVGIKANLGRQGAETAFESTLKSLLNIQHNHLCKGSKLGILGHFNFSEEMEKAKHLSTEDPSELKQLRELVSDIDKRVTYLNAKIIRSGKIPLIIGGGHNNAYGNIKGLSLAKNQPVHAINFDAHTDFRELEGRHSGNGFSYAFDQNFLIRYFIFGLHENYTSKKIFKKMDNLEEHVRYNTFEEMEVRQEKEFRIELKTAKEFIKSRAYGVELDLDAIENVASSAITPSGFSVTSARKFVHTMGNHANASYLHICEGAPSLDNFEPSMIGKLITYFITDFIKARTPHLDSE